jgi:DNA-binding transcriptional LysR family regulator
MTPHVLTIFAPSYLQLALLPQLAVDSEYSLRAVLLATPNARREGHCAVFSVGLPEHLPGSWSSEAVEQIEYAVLASPALAQRLPARPTVDDIRNVAFVAPVTISSAGDVTQGVDYGPLPPSQRVIAHEVESFTLGCHLAAAAEFLIHGPVCAATEFLERGTLVTVPIVDWHHTDHVYFACDKGEVSAVTRNWLKQGMRRALAMHPATSLSGVVSSLVTTSCAVRS